MTPLRATVAMLAFVSCGADPTVDPAMLGVHRTTDVIRIHDPLEWGAPLEQDLENEYWDIITNSDHAAYPEWRDKVGSYIEVYSDANPRLALLVAAGGIFRMTEALQGDNVDFESILQYVPDVLQGGAFAFEAMPDDEAAQVFYHNDRALHALLIGPREQAVNHLQQLLAVPGPEGRAAATFTYGLLEDSRATAFAIELSEDCRTFVCNWTSKIAPYKPIVQLLVLAELQAIIGQNDEMNRLLDEAERLAEVRDWPLIDRIEVLRGALPELVYLEGEGRRRGLGLMRWPTPMFSNSTHCGTCHVGALSARYSEGLDQPFVGHDVVTNAPIALDPIF